MTRAEGHVRFQKIDQQELCNLCMRLNTILWRPHTFAVWTKLFEKLIGHKCKVLQVPARTMEVNSIIARKLFRLRHRTDNVLKNFVSKKKDRRNCTVNYVVDTS